MRCPTDGSKINPAVPNKTTTGPRSPNPPAEFYTTSVNPSCSTISTPPIGHTISTEAAPMNFVQGQHYPVVAADAYKVPSARTAASPTRVSTPVATQSGIRRTIRSTFGGYLACLVWVFLVSLCGGGVGVVQAAFKPANKAALKAAVGTCTLSGSYPSYTYSCTGGCLGETPDGSCPNFAASNGVIGDWDVSLVTDMSRSTYTLSLPLQDRGFFRLLLFPFFFLWQH